MALKIYSNECFWFSLVFMVLLSMINFRIKLEDKTLKGVSISLCSNLEKSIFCQVYQFHFSKQSVIFERSRKEKYLS